MKKITNSSLDIIYARNNAIIFVEIIILLLNYAIKHNQNLNLEPHLDIYNKSNSRRINHSCMFLTALYVLPSAEGTDYSIYFRSTIDGRWTDL